MNTFLSSNLWVFFLRTGKPVRCMLDRHEDMLITGGRNPFLCRYNVGISEDGKIQVLDVLIYNNAGSSRDLSAAVNILLYLFIVFRLILFYCRRPWRDVLIT